MTLIVNPHATIKPAEDQPQILLVRSPVRHQGLKVTRIERAAEPSLFGALLVQAALPQPGFVADLSEAERVRLATIGFLVQPDAVSHPVSYACDLDGDEDEEAPSDRLRLDARSDDLIVNPTVIHLGPSGPTPEMRGRLKLPDPFRSGRSWLSLRTSAAQVRAFFSWSPDRTPALADLRPGQALPASFDARMRQRLVESGVAIRRSAGIAGAEDLSLRQAALKAERYVVLRQATHPRQANAIRRYYRDLIDEGFLIFGDKDWPLRYFARYDPIAHFFHEQWTEFASSVAMEPLKASFPFFAAYHPGADLPAHRDREQCLFSISVQIDHEPEPVGDAPWPIYLQPGGPETAIPVTLRVGEAAMFYGQELLHYREALKEGTSSFWFLFYVSKDFDGPLD